MLKKMKSLKLNTKLQWRAANRLTWLFLLLLISNAGRAAKDEVHNVNTATNLLQDLSVESQQYSTVNNNSLWSNQFRIKQINNEITFGIDESYLLLDASYAYKIQFDLSWEELQGNVLVSQSLSSVELDINYDPSVSYKDRAVYTFENGMKVDITNVKLFKKNSGIWVSTTVDRENLFLKSSVETEYFNAFDRFYQPGSSSSDISMVISGSEIQVNWLSIDGAEEYELEWTWVHNYTGDINGGVPDFYYPEDVNYNFNESATRVRLSHNSYKIPVIYRNGFLLVRYRGIGIGGINLDRPIEGTWCNVPESGTVAQCPVNCMVETVPVDGHDFNYSAELGIVEEGTKGVVVQYMDGTGKLRQSISKMNSQREVLAKSTVYDYYGRPAIETMGSPVQQASLNYIPGLNRDVNGGVYDKDDFHQDVLMFGSCGMIPAQAMSESLSQGASRYYSDQNNNKEGAEAYLPDGDGYTFMHTYYANDPTSRVKRVGGVGPDHQLTEGGHYTETLYEPVEGNETYYLFGSDAAPTINYTRVITRDANGQVNVAITDSYGRTVAKYLEGPAPAGLEPIEGNTGMSATAADLMPYTSDSPNLLEAGILQVQKKVVVIDPAVEYQFNYDFTAEVFNDCLPLDVCFDCVYEVEFSITPIDGQFTVNCAPEDENGVEYPAPYSWTRYVGAVTQFDTDCEQPLVFSNENPGDESFVIKFPKFGEYYVTKTLKVAQEPMEYYWQQYVENSDCITPFSDYLNIELQNIDFSTCDEYTPCLQTFIETYGTWDIYSQATGETDEQVYLDLREEYVINCENAPICEQLYPILIGDVSPGGQYASLDPTDEYSVFNESNSLGFSWRDIVQYGTSTPVDIVTSSGDVYPVNDPLVTINDFLSNWDQQWAEQLLVAHPEYITYTFCTTYPDVFSYINDFKLTDNWNDALNNGYLDPAGGSTYACLASAPTTPVVIQDPLIGLMSTASTWSAWVYMYYVPAGAPNPYSYQNQANNLLNTCSGGIDLYQLAAFMADDTPFGQSTCDNDAHWINFRDLYLGRRAMILQVMMELWACENGGPHVRCIDYANSYCSSTYGPPNPYEEKIKRFTMFDQFMPEAYLESVDNGAPANPGPTVSNGFCESQCTSLSESWMDALSECANDMPGNGGAPWESGQSFYDQLEGDLVAVCQSGCSYDWPMASQYGSSSSFETVISGYLPGGLETVGCNHFLITTPAAIPNQTLVHTLNQCGCDQLLSVSSEEEFEIEYGFLPLDFCDERAECANAIGANIANTYPLGSLTWDQSQIDIIEEYLTPNNYECAGEGCITCEELADALNDLDNEFHVTNVAAYPALFTNFVNEMYGTSFTYASLIGFLEDCDNYNTGLITGGFTAEANDLVQVLNGLAVGGLLNNQTHTPGSLLSYFSASFTVAPEFGSQNVCDPFPTSDYNYVPVWNGSGFYFDINHNDCRFCIDPSQGTITVAISQMGSFATAQEAVEATQSFGAPYTTTGGSNFNFLVDAIAINDQGEEVILKYSISIKCFGALINPDELTLCENEGFVFDDHTDCMETLVLNATEQALDIYEEYLETERDEFMASYISTCVGVDEEYNYEYESNRYHYTLFYFDRADNLVMTIPPKGVNPLTDTQVDDIVNNGLEIYPSHSYKTRYQFNSMNQPVVTSTPDGEDSRIWYDHISRPVVSQNARQEDFETGLLGGNPNSGVNVPTYNYTQYDYLGRVSETAEIMQPTAMTDAISKSPNALRTWIDPAIPTGLAKHQIVRTHYSEPFSVAAETEFGGDGYGDIRNRIAAVEKHEGWFQPGPGGFDFTDPDYVNHFSYDVHGNAKTFLQQTEDLAQYDREFIRTDYEYDLLNGLTNEVHFQEGEIDQISHKYLYDADNRLKEVYTSKDGVIWDRDASYHYRLDGLLARTELGEMKVQGSDLAYTLHGWIKSMNAGVLDATKDMGKDGMLNGTGTPEYHSAYPNMHDEFAQDAFNFTLSYYANDYKAIDNTKPWNLEIAGSAFESDLNPLYNGNIQYMTTALSALNSEPLRVQGTTFKYDQLHRFKESHVFISSAITNNNSMFGAMRQNASTSINGNALGDFEVHVDFDPNGNITDLERRAYTSPDNNNDNLMDDFHYNYLTEENKLETVNEVANEVLDYGDILGSEINGNAFAYHDDGSLKSDTSEMIGFIDWYPDGKVKQIYRLPGSTKPDTYFEYSFTGNRCLKVEKTKDGSGNLLPSTEWKYTWYGMDGNEQSLAVYNRNESQTDLIVNERFINGSNRLGLDQNVVTVNTPVTKYKERVLGLKNFELSDHRGNVYNVITDRKLVVEDPNNGALFYKPQVNSAVHYYPYGMTIPMDCNNGTLQETQQQYNTILEETFE